MDIQRFAPRDEEKREETELSGQPWPVT
jgi:hypothetical protein